MAPADASSINSRARKSMRLRDHRLTCHPQGITSIPSNGKKTASAQLLELRTAALAAGTWTTTVTSVAPAPAAMVRGVMVMVDPAGPPLAESVTAAGIAEPVLGAMVR